MSEGAEPGPQGGSGTEPGSVERPKLRRRPFGYKASDVDEVLDARDTELAELRQDVAALWLAFAQHDRMIRTALEGGAAPAAAPPANTAPRPASPAPETTSAPPPGPDVPEPDPTDLPTPEQVEAEVALKAASDAEIGRQLSDLDDVLATIEEATRTLERTYADEIAEDGDLLAGPRDTPNPDDDAGPGAPAEGDADAGDAAAGAPAEGDADAGDEVTRDEAAERES